MDGQGPQASALAGGSPSRGRTGTPFRAADFKSAASAIPPRGRQRVAYFKCRSVASLDRCEHSRHDGAVFTGITQGLCAVVAVERQPALLTYTVALEGALSAGLQVGASVAVNGVCQTVVQLEGGQAVFQAIAETLERTTLGGLRVGDRVSIERSAKLGDEVGGHELSGHVLGTARVAKVVDTEGRYELWLELPGVWAKYLFEKGFLAVDGSSLTVASVVRNAAKESEASVQVCLCLIPHTLSVTNLGEKRAGDRVNIELDVRTVAIVDTVERVLAEREPTAGRQ